MRFLAPLSLASMLLPLGGCVQLIAFDQPLIGQPDVIENPESRGDVLCDEDVRLGERAMCDISCSVEAGDVEVGCGDHVSIRDGALRVDPEGFFEVEVTLTACSPLERTVRLTTARGAGISVEGRAARIFGEDDELLAEEERFLPDEECHDRTVLLQDGRLELVERGRRWCSPSLPRFDESWTLDMPGEGLQSIEVCLRQAG